MLLQSIVFTCMQLAVISGEYSIHKLGFERNEFRMATGSAKSYMLGYEEARGNMACRTWAIVTEMKEYVDFINPDDDSRAFLILNSPTFAKFAHKEHTVEQLLNPVYCGPLRYVPQCQIVFVLSLKTPGQHENMVNYLAGSRFARMHKDYFFFIGIPEVVVKFMQTEYKNGIRYKYFVNYDHSAAVHDGCSDVSSSGTQPSLFTSKCDFTLSEKKFTVTSVLGAPWCRLELGTDGEIISANGIYFRLLTNAASHYNFTFSLQYANSGGASGFKRNGLWYGAVGEIYGRTADIALGCGISSNRDPVVDNGITFEWMSRVFFISHPPLDSNWKAMFAPFKLVSWILISSTSLFITPVYYFSLKWWRWRHGQRHVRTTLVEIMKPLITIHFEQEVADVRNWVDSRIRFTVGSLMIFILVMSAGYRASLIYFLGFIPLQIYPSTHRALLEYDYTVLFRYYGGVEFEPQAPEPVQRGIAKRAILVNTSSADCIVQAILTEGSACLDWEPHGSFAVYTNATMNADQRKSLMIKSTDSVMNVMVAWVYKKWSPLTESFDVYIGNTLASGIYMKWQRDDFTKSRLSGARWQKEQTGSPVHEKLEQIIKEDTPGPKALQLKALVGVFGLAWFGWVNAVLVYFVQVCLAARKRYFT